MMRALLIAAIAVSCVADEPPKQLDDNICWPPFQSEAPAIEMPTPDADGKLTADQIAQLSAQIEAVKLFELRAMQAFKQYEECRLACGYSR